MDGWMGGLTGVNWLLNDRYTSAANDHIRENRTSVVFHTGAARLPMMYEPFTKPAFRDESSPWRQETYPNGTSAYFTDFAFTYTDLSINDRSVPQCSE